MRALLEKIRQKPESHKQGVALSLSLVITFLVALGWAGQRGMIGGGDLAEAPKVENQNQTALSVNALSPIESSKQSLSSGLSQIKEVYDSFKDSLASVLVPFITGIEVYERK